MLLRDQPYAEKEKSPQAVHASSCQVKEYDEDRYGRLIVELFTEDNISINPDPAQVLHGGTSITLRQAAIQTMPGRCSEEQAWFMG